MKKLVLYFDPKAKKVFVDKLDEEGHKKTFLSSPHNFVYASEIVARIIEYDDEDQIPTRIDPGYDYYNIVNYVSLKTGSGLYYDEMEKAYKAAEYGFVVFDGKTLNLLPLLKINREKTKAFLTIFPTKFSRIPTVRDIDEMLQERNILARVGEKVLKEQLDAINPEEKKVHRVLVAQGKEPVNGRDEYYMPLMNIEKKAGEILADGRIDFKEVGSIIQVSKDQEILERYPPVKPADGYDVYGDKIPADMEPPQGYKRGENIVQSGRDDNVFVAGLDGCLEVDKRTISVLPMAIIKHDVDYESGNIDFNGSVHVKGSVLAGFSVKATGDVIIENNVDDGSVEAGGDITVKLGIVGKGQARVIAGGALTAKYLLNATIEAVNEITVEDSIINCDVFSNNSINLVAKQGKIIGSTATALYRITVNVSGSPNYTETSLNVGRNLFIERELEALRKQIGERRESVAEIMRKLKVSFGEGIFENPKEFISILPPVKKKNALLLLKELGEGNKELKGLVEESKKVQEKLKLDQEPVVIVTDKVFPGSIISIKKSVRKIDKELQNVRFYEDPDEKVIRFTSAS
jgi:hypothetical protein